MWTQINQSKAEAADIYCSFCSEEGLFVTQCCCEMDFSGLLLLTIGNQKNTHQVNHRYAEYKESPNPFPLRAIGRYHIGCQQSHVKHMDDPNSHLNVCAQVWTFNKSQGDQQAHCLDCKCLDFKEICDESWDTRQLRQTVTFLASAKEHAGLQAIDEHACSKFCGKATDPTVWRLSLESSDHS
eukprot:m.9168 g.9168  ORF g.9168 m.9168 type:complete len:183 (+) comp5430_c0_seq2:3-551(+)